jgi:ketosteroid isomerase-like protein
MFMEQNRKVVEEYFDCLNERDADRLAGLLTETFTWILPVRAEALKSMSVPRNKEESIQRIKAIFSAMRDKPQMKPFAWTMEGDRAAVESEGHIVWNNDKVFDCLYHHAFVLRDGKIDKCTEYLDFLYVWETHPLVKR